MNTVMVVGRRIRTVYTVMVTVVDLGGTDQTEVMLFVVVEGGMVNSAGD